MRQFDWFGLLIGLSFGFVSGFIFKGCDQEPCPAITLTSTDTVKGDSVPYPVYVGVPKPYKVTDPITPVNWDSLLNVDGERYKAAIDSLLNDYLLRRHYTDTFKSDTSCTVGYYALVSRNRLDSFALFAQNNRPTVINHYLTNPPDRVNVFAGLYYVNAPGISAEAITGKWSFGVGVDLNKKALVSVKYKLPLN